ncbi:hybrid sensor histidine kinase/response regulator transcription factor [Marinifilum sp. RC60d5]|uniref:hybrid sensor histidine kinase/response regulator transcription factor n=1 Tax=Marinifilum sp. RC60d5 TaxID=3458414 RepID=UPI0040353FF5
MLKRYSILIFIILLQVSSSLRAEDQLKVLQQLSISDGLAHNGVTAIIEDSNGYLWFGTYDGLNRYDGYELRTFKNLINKNILTSNRVRSLLEDKKGNIWVGTDEGVTIYNYSTEKFDEIYSNFIANKGISGPVVRRIIENKNRNIIVCATGMEGILIFNDDYTFSKQYIPSEREFGENIDFNDGVMLDDENYVFSAETGVFLFNLKKAKFTRLFEKQITSTTSIEKAAEGSLILTLGSGLIILDYKKEDVEYSFKMNSTCLKDNEFKNVSVDNNGNLFLSTLRKGFVFVDNFEKLKANTPVKKKVYKFDSKLLRGSCVLFSERFGVWAGTFNEGIFRLTAEENPFQAYNIDMHLKMGLKSNLVNHISLYDTNKLLISANYGGVALYDVSKKKFTHVPFSISEKERVSINAAYVDSKNNFWLRKVGDLGLCWVKHGTNKIQKIESKLLSENMFLTRIYAEDKYGNIWCGTNENVYRIKLNESGDIKKIESLNNHPSFKNNRLWNVRYIYADPVYDYMWICADYDGLYRIPIGVDADLNDLKVEQYLKEKGNSKSLSSNFVTSIIRLPNKELWLGTEGGGICKVINNNSKLEFIAYSEADGLSNNVVKSILYDDDNNLWISTNIGLNRFNTKDYSFRKFSTKDGLPFDDFWYASCRLKNGLLFFSGLDGFCYFNPKDITDSENLPLVEFGDFSLFNKKVSPLDTFSNRVLLKSRLNELDELELNYDENVFSIELKSLHYSAVDNHFLKYQLLPNDKDWIEVPSNQRFIDYSGLQPGEYELQVIASNSLNQWTDARKLKITIKPPIWKTIPAYALYIVILISVVYMIIMYVLRFQKLNYSLQIEKLEKDKNKEVNAAKLRFFSNISHEIKTPIALISGPVDLLSARFIGNKDVSEKLQLIQRQSKKISQLVDQVHDFQRSDANQLKINYSTFGFDSFLKELLKDFEFMTQNTGKELDVFSKCSDVYVTADRDKLEKILNNLLNNACKFTKENDKISVEYTCEERDLIVKVQDTGRGITKEDLPQIFERFYQSKHKHAAYIGGSGIGLAFTKRLVEMHYGEISADSILNEGTTITVRMPIIAEQVSEDLKKKEEELLSLEKQEDNNSMIKNRTEQEINVEGDFSDASIFLAEDNDELRNFVGSSLSQFFKVKTFINGQECLNAMEEEWPDLIISDILMPELNGLDLCRHVKTDIKTSHIPVILLTACTSIDDQIKGIQEGADSYIKKPFDLQHLVKRTEYLLRNRQKLRERFLIDFPLKKDKSKAKGDENIFLEKLYKLMADNLDNQELDLNQFAKELFLNRTHFYQKVKALTNQTPFELLKAYRLKKAAEFLVQQQLSVNEVYLMTGFKSRTHFSKLFKEKYNITPGKFASESMKKFSKKDSEN